MVGVLRVAVGDEAPGMLGSYSVADGALRFTPLYPLDPGREYRVRFDPARLPGAALPGAGAIVATVGSRRATRRRSTVVTRVYPTERYRAREPAADVQSSSRDQWGGRAASRYMKLLDEDGKEIPGAFLPLDYEFWSPDHTRFTAFFDPGRVKDGILPNQEMGRALDAGALRHAGHQPRVARSARTAA